MKRENVTKWIALLTLATTLLMAVSAQNPNRSKPFSWDNANVYFMITDRFYDGNPANNHSYDRGLDPSGATYGTTNSSSGLYQNTGAFQGGDLSGVTKKITEGYFDKLGTNAIWITAPYEQIHGWVGGGPAQDFQHYGYHGYYALDWTEMDANMGTANELKALVDTAHAHGIRIVMDVVMNHAGYQTFNDVSEFGFGAYDVAGETWRPAVGAESPWGGFHQYWKYAVGNGWENWWGAEWVRSPDIKGYDTCSPGGGQDNCVGYLPDFKTESKSVVGLPKLLIDKWKREGTYDAKVARMDAWFAKTGNPKTIRFWLIEWLSNWVRTYGIDGFRIDTAKHVDLDTWKELLDECRVALNEWKAANPTKKLDDNEFWATAEVWGHGFSESEYHTVATFNSVINFNLQTDSKLASPSQWETLFQQFGAVNPNNGWNGLSYISSHDTKLYDRTKLKTIAPAFLMLPGGIQTFYGDESVRPLGTCADAEQQTRSFMNWSAPDNATLALWQKFGAFRRDHSAVGAGVHKQLVASPYTFSRTYDNAALRINDKVVCVYGASGATTVDVSSVFENGDVIRDWPTGAKATVTNGKITFTPDADGYLLLGWDVAKPYVDRPVVTITPNGGYSKDPILVTIAAKDFSDANPTIYYTTDPLLSTADLSKWTKYTAPFSVTTTGDVRAVAKNSNGYLSDVITKGFAVGELPTITIYVKKATNWTSPCKIHYFDVLPEGVLADNVWASRPAMKDDGGDWFEYTFQALSVSMVFTDAGANQLPGSTEPAYTRTKTSWFDANTKTWSETAPAGAPNGLSPIISPAGGNYPTGSVAITMTAPQGGDIHYTIDGSTPTVNSPIYTASFTLSGSAGVTKTVKAITNKNGVTSTVSTSDYTFNQVTTITIFYRGKSHIYGYTAEGAKNPAWNAWPGYTNTPTAAGWYQHTFECTSLKVIFNNNGATETTNFLRSANSWWDNGVWTDVAPADAPTLGDANAPTFNPAAGTFPLGTPISVSLILPAGATGSIFYTVDGSTPSAQSTPYTAPITLSSTTTIKAVLIANSGNYYSTATYSFSSTPTMTLHFYKPSEFGAASPRMHAWSSGSNPLTGVWPGMTMTDEGNGWWKATVSGVTCANVIFNNGASLKTAEMMNVCDNSYWRWDGALKTATQDATSIFKKSATLEGEAPYPNPFSSKLSFKLNIENSDVTVSLYSLTGAVVYTNTLFITDQLIEIEPDVPAGIYILKATSEQGSYRYKVVKH